MYTHRLQPSLRGPAMWCILRWHSADDIDICTLIHVYTHIQAIAKGCRTLVYLDMAHCRRITDRGLRSVLRHCPQVYIVKIVLQCVAVCCSVLQCVGCSNHGPRSAVCAAQLAVGTPFFGCIGLFCGYAELFFGCTGLFWQDTQGSLADFLG